MDITTSILLTVILVLLTVRLYNWLFTSCNYWTCRGIPSVPGALPIVGNTFSIIRLHENLAIYCKSIYESYRGKSMVGFYHLKKPVLMVRDPDLVKTVLQTSFNNFQHNETILDLETDPLVGRDPLFSCGQTWKDSRATFVSGLSIKSIKNMSLVIANVCKKLEDHLAEKMKNKDYLELDSNFLFARYSIEVAAGSVLGIDGNSFADDYKGTLFDYLKMNMDSTRTRALKCNILSILPALSKFIKTRLVPVEVDKYFRSVVTHVENLRENDAVVRTDFLQLMLDLEKKLKISRIQVISHAFSFFLESFASTSLALSSIFYLIAKHEEIQNRMRAEVETVLAKHEGRLTYEAINEMRYLEQVMNEALRLFPIAGVFCKSCTNACRLEGSDGLTVDVEPGTTVLIPVLGLQTDPEIWENPEEFNPERFEKGNIDERHKFVHLPFGEGPKACPGQRLGVINVKAAMATVLRNYRIELSPKMQEPLRFDPCYWLLAVAGGYWIRLRPIDKN